MKVLNIALLHYSCPPVVGGVEEIVRQQASLFRRNFHNVKIFAGAGEQFTDEYPVEINPLLSSRNKQIENAHRLAREGVLDAIEALAKRIFNYLKNQLRNFDVLIAHNVLTMRYNLPLTYALFRLAQEDLIPIISWNHDSPYFYPNYPEYLDHSPWSILKRFNQKIYYVVISESRRKQFSRLYHARKHIFVVPNGIDPIRFFRLDPVTVRLIREQHLFTGDFLLVQPSRLHPRKNIELSIRVIRALQDMGIKARLLVTGAYDPHESKTVEYYKKLKALARELNVQKDVLILAEYKFSSGQPLAPDRIIIRDLYMIADILFLPSNQEGFGIPLLEAGMIKLPIVCSSIAPFKEIGGRDVCYFDLNDSPDTIAQKIIKFTQGLEPTRFFRKVIQNYAWDNIYENKLYPLLKAIVSEHRDLIDKKLNHIEETAEG